MAVIAQKVMGTFSVILLYVWFKCQDMTGHVQFLSLSYTSKHIHDTAGFQERFISFVACKVLIFLKTCLRYVQTNLLPR
jgi:hypothetical protein